MLILDNNGNWETSHRISTEKPEAHLNAGTVILPVNVEETTVVIETESEGGEKIQREVPGYEYEEYHVNHPIGLPQEALDAYQGALELFSNALSIVMHGE